MPDPYIQTETDQSLAHFHDAEFKRQLTFLLGCNLLARGMIACLGPSPRCRSGRPLGYVVLSPCFVPYVTAIIGVVVLLVAATFVAQSNSFAYYPLVACCNSCSFLCCGNFIWCSSFACCRNFASCSRFHFFLNQAPRCHRNHSVY